MGTPLPWYRRLPASSIPEELVKECEDLLALVGEDLGLGTLKIQWCEKVESLNENAHRADPDYFYDDAIRMSYRGRTVYLRHDWDLPFLRSQIAFRAATMAKHQGQSIHPGSYRPPSDPREMETKPAPSPNDSVLIRDQLKGQTTEHADPPRLEDEGQSGG